MSCNSDEHSVNIASLLSISSLSNTNTNMHPNKNPCPKSNQSNYQNGMRVHERCPFRKVHFTCIWNAVCVFYHWTKHNICEIVYCAHIFHTFHLDLSSRALVHQRSCSQMMIIARAILPLFHFYWNFTWFSQNCIRIVIFLENYRKKNFSFVILNLTTTLRP